MAGQKRGAPNKKGLGYFPKMVDFYEDDKVFDLLDRYGPLGVTVYDCILCIVYRNGYYAEIPLDKLSKMIVRMIGNKWVKSQKAVVQVVHFCSEIGLIDDGLMTKNIITSVGIQRRFYEIAVKRMKRQLYNDQYWLLDKEENGEPLLKSPKNQIPSELNGISSEENRITSELKPIEIKENKNIYYSNPELDSAFRLYIAMRNNNQKNPLMPEQVNVLKEELDSVADTDEEKAAICKKAFQRGWKGFFPLKKRKKKDATGGSNRNSFHNFDQREVDYDDLEKRLTNKKP